MLRNRRRLLIAALFACALIAGPTPLAGAAQQGQPAAAGSGKTQVTWYGHAAFTVKTPVVPAAVSFVTPVPPICGFGFVAVSA